MRPWPQFDGLDRAGGEMHRTNGPTVEVKSACGAVLGRHRAGVLEFLGIPYAQAPVGSFRFAAPVKKPPFEPVFPALSYGDAAPQRSPLPQTLGRLFGMPTGQSENCLNLNIWTPSALCSSSCMVALSSSGQARNIRAAILPGAVIASW